MKGMGMELYGDAWATPPALHEIEVVHTQRINAKAKLSSDLYHHCFIQKVNSTV